MTNEIKRVFDDEKSRPGSPLVTKRLNDEGHRVSHHTVTKIMKTKVWRAKAAQKYKAPTNSNRLCPVGTTCRWHQTSSWLRIFKRLRQIRNGFRISHKSGLANAGFIWLLSWSCIPAQLSAGPWQSAWQPAWFVMP